MKTSLLFFTSLLLLLTLSACSNTKKSNTSDIQKMEKGTVVAVKLDRTVARPTRPNGNVGVSVGSGGHAGVYGSVDFATIGNIFSKSKKDKVMQKIIVERTNGSLVEITQPDTQRFSRGDKVKIIHQGNQARVVH